MPSDDLRGRFLCHIALGHGDVLVFHKLNSFPQLVDVLMRVHLICDAFGRVTDKPLNTDMVSSP